jgi:hypothetical protein
MNLQCLEIVGDDEFISSAEKKYLLLCGLERERERDQATC